MSTHTEGPWVVATSNSWRRIVSMGLGGMQSVCEPIKQNDGHPDLYFRNGGADGPDARLIAAAPDLLAALQTFLAEYVSLVNSGDAGNWDAEEEDKVIAARAAIAKATGGAS